MESSDYKGGELVWDVGMKLGFVNDSQFDLGGLRPYDQINQGMHLMPVGGGRGITGLAQNAALSREMVVDSSIFDRDKKEEGG
jgi:hypothetical protein